MSSALLSINPEHVQKILAGTKRFEFRKVAPRRPVDRIVIYSTTPIGAVVAEAEVTSIIEGMPSDVWARTHLAAGISRTFFDTYFSGRTRAVAYCLGTVTTYAVPLNLATFGVSSAPQSFVYLEQALAA